VEIQCATGPDRGFFINNSACTGHTAIWNALCAASRVADSNSSVNNMQVKLSAFGFGPPANSAPKAKRSSPDGEGERGDGSKKSARLSTNQAAVAGAGELCYPFLLYSMPLFVCIIDRLLIFKRQTNTQYFLMIADPYGLTGGPAALDLLNGYGSDDEGEVLVHYFLRQL
jgi:hypothetical protein